MTAAAYYHQRLGGRQSRGHGRRRAAMSSSNATAAAIFFVLVVVVVVVVDVFAVVETNDSLIFFTAVSAFQTSKIIILLSRPTTASSLSLPLSYLPRISSRPSSSVVLNLGPMEEDLSEYGKNKQRSELDSLTSKREAIKRAKLANIKPNDDEPRLVVLTANDDNNDNDDNNISHDELQQLLQRLQKEKENDVFAMPEFKTKRIVNPQQRGLSSGTYGGDTKTADNSNSNNNNNISASKASSNNENDTNSNNNAIEGEEEENNNLFIDWTTDYNDENELHIPNRIGVTTQYWGNVKLGYVDGKKLKKKDRAVGRYNKNDLKKAYTKLQRNGISFIETSMSYPPIANDLLNEFHSSSDLSINNNNNVDEQKPVMASSFPNVWKYAFTTRSILPLRRGALSIVSGAEESCEQLSISSLSLYQITNPRPFYSMNTLADGMLDVISDDHSRYVGCVHFHNVQQLVRLQKLLKLKGGEYISTNKFDFSLTNRKYMGLIMACKKLGITPLCTSVLDNGLATGRYTSTNPTGGEVSTKEGDLGPYSVRKLEKLDVLFRTQESLREKINLRIGNTIMKMNDKGGGGGGGPKLNRDVTTTQIAINYVRAKGAVPLVSVTNVKMANEVLGCLGWDLSDEEVEELDRACKSCGI